ncbi:hypothetical protein COO60DRAFT_1697601 [Scenedesmus sp. NREL 46B-D3]|nr:hypothetical protein COO60DRAFT_1697601 [Scenedesmus sp. NREL 46B-D3]
MREQQRPGLWIIYLIIALFAQTRIAYAATYLRTATIDAEDWTDPEWRTRSGHHRSLLGATDCSDPRWSFLCGRVQILVQLADGHTAEDKKALIASLRADGAVISGYLPRDTWLVVARLQDLRSSVYSKHVLLPFSPEYKVAPEWHPVLELVEQQHKQHLSSEHQRATAATRHVQLHRQVLEHSLVQQLQLHTPEQHHWRGAGAGAAVADAVVEQLAENPAKLLVGVNFPDVPDAELHRLGVEPGTFNPAAAAAVDWEAPLSQLVAADGRCQHHMQLCQPELLARSRMELNIAVCPQDLSEVLHWLSGQAAVHWLAPRPRLRLQNAIASMIVQNNGIQPTADYKAPDAHFFWQAGLDGKGQVVGIGDSGIDMNSCFFRDPANPFNPPTDGKEWISPNHRKVVYYYGIADTTFRDQVGHGTHTGGSIVGEDAADPTSKATGGAKGAKLAFVDISMQPTQVNAPQELDTEYFPKMYAQGARIFSDSWGSGNAEYDLQSSRVDAWLHSNQDCVSHFAAGNYGESDNLDTTITSPGVAKNVVTVGATKSRQPNYLSQTIAPVFLMLVEVNRTGKVAQFINVRLVKADFGGDGTALSGKGLRMVRASPPAACGSLDDAASGKYKDAIVLAHRGTCFFSEKMAAGSAAGAAAVVIINDRPGGYFKMDAQDGQVLGTDSISLLAVTQRLGEEIWSLFDNANSIAATIERYTDTWEAFEDIAAFSSFGPAKDGRIKPDIVCPGELTSASSSQSGLSTDQQTCQIGRKSGTSMATPMVAGHAAIIRQYFMDGFYPTGAANAADAYVPSGPLIKAVMMGGACDMKGNTEAYLPLEDSPSMRQGFGRLCLCSSLRLAGKCSTNVQVVDRATITDKETHKYCIRSIGGDIRIMLVWYDPPAAVSTGDGASPTLINDLDLVVTSAGMGGQTLFGNQGQTKDSVNTAERVWLRDVPAGGVEISVSAAINVPDGTPQNYSLVVQGAFAGELASPFNPDPAAKAATPGSCPAQLMLSTAPAADAAGAIAAAALTTMAAPADETTAVSAMVVQESAAAPGAVERGTAGAEDPAIETLPEAGDAAASPAVEAVPESPSPSPGVDSSALVGMLISTMTTAVASPVPAGRRLTWLPSPPAAATLRLPARVCHFLSAVGLVPERTAAPEGGRVLDVSLGALVVVVGAGLLLAVAALFVRPSLRRQGVSRTTSLTTALHEDLHVKSCMIAGTKRGNNELLLEHLLPAESVDAAAAAAGGPSRSSSRALNQATSSILDNTPTTSGTCSSESSTPTSPTAPRCSSPFMQGRLPPTWSGGRLLPSASSCPGSFSFAAPQQSEAAEHNGGISFSFSHMEGAAAPQPQHAGRPSRHSYSFTAGPALQPAALPPWLALMSASMDVQGQCTQQVRSSSAPGLPPQVPLQQQQQQGAGSLLQGRSCPLLSQQQAAAARPMSRSSSFTLAVSSSKQQQAAEATPAGVLTWHDAEASKDQQDITCS